MTFSKQYISVLERTYSLPNDKEVIGIYPPLQSFRMENCQFIALSKTLDNKEAYHITATHLNGLIQQQNYANLFLKIVGEQIGSLHSKMDNILSLLTEKPEIKQDNNTNNASSSTGGLVPPLIASLQNPPEIKNFIVKANHEWEEKLLAQAQVNKQVQELLLEKMEQLSIQTLTDNRLYNSHASSAEDEINILDTKWSQKPTQRFFYYSRPSPLDVLHEEQEFQINNSYNGKCIYEWNIDGHTDSQVYNQMIVSGFTGQLKGWWDNYLTPAMKASVYNAKTTGENPVENANYTLTINIIEQFTGIFLNNNENIRTLLQNLRCKTLTDYRWYKDTFLSRVMELPESSNAHWKAKFIDGLPHLFAERVRTALRGQHNAIPYDNYSYGKLIGTCTEQGLKLCNEIKLTEQIKRQNLTERNQLGDFCGQFGIDMPYPSHKKRKTFKDSYSKPFYKRKRNKPFIKRNQTDKSGKNPVKPYFKKNFKNKPNKKNFCFKCNKIGHYAQDCWTKKSISTLEIDDTIKDKLYKLFLNSDNEEIDSSSSNNEIKKMDNDSYFSDSSDSTCEPCLKGKECVKNNNDDLYNLISQFEEHQINVLDNNNWIELLKVIKDPETRSKIIDQMGNDTSSSTSQVQEIEHNSEPSSMSKVYSLLKDC
ncbi:hypothetical protein RND81_11G167100 [Saponaria officinalis]|uniref:CCHC-type domain-containing protein n=1 Tax=Saponaria officinalis TaxID=3572 RepID=A0AAW1HMU9_SAPOF